MIPLGAADKVEGRAERRRRATRSRRSPARPVDARGRPRRTALGRAPPRCAAAHPVPRAGAGRGRPSWRATRRWWRSSATLPPTPDRRARRQIVAGNLDPALTQPERARLPRLAQRALPAPFDTTIDVTDSGLDDGTPRPLTRLPRGRRRPCNPDRIDYQSNYTADADTRDCTGHGTNVASIAAGYNASTRRANEDGAGFNYGLGRGAAGARSGVSKIFDCDGARGPASAPATRRLQRLRRRRAASRTTRGDWAGPASGGPTAPRRATTTRSCATPSPAPPATSRWSRCSRRATTATIGDGTRLDRRGSAKNVITVGRVRGRAARSGTDGCGTPTLSDNAAPDRHVLEPRADQRRPAKARPRRAGHAHHRRAARGARLRPRASCARPPSRRTYSLASGTSQAAPQVAGAAALVRDWYLDNVRARPSPSPAMTKALLINTATDLAAGPDNEPGLGEGQRSGSAFDSTRRASSTTSSPATCSATPGRPWCTPSRSTTPSKPVKVTLAWTDAAGTADRQRVRQRPRPRGRRRRADLPRQRLRRAPTRARGGAATRATTSRASTCRRAPRGASP